MRLKFFCPWWGLDHLEIEAMVDRIASSGYDGIETYVPADPAARTRLRRAIDAAGLDCIAHCYEADGDLEAWTNDYRVLLERACDLEPAFINSHTGRDHWSPDAVDRVLEVGFDVEQTTGIAILHETHRSRFPYSAAVTASYLARYPELQLTADLSHWACVSESLLEDQQHLLEPALARSLHVHARVGWAQGAQVPDARHPRWSRELETHIDWWRRIRDHRAQAGASEMTITTEYGPPPYSPVDLVTGEPLTDFEELDRWMRDLLRIELASPLATPTADTTADRTNQGVLECP
jgi:hypothetical protein